MVSDASFLYFSEQIELNISEQSLILREKIPAFSQTHAKMNLGDYFCEALIGV